MALFADNHLGGSPAVFNATQQALIVTSARLLADPALAVRRRGDQYDAARLTFLLGFQPGLTEALGKAGAEPYLEQFLSKADLKPDIERNLWREWSKPENSPEGRVEAEVTGILLRRMTFIIPAIDEKTAAARMPVARRIPANRDWGLSFHEALVADKAAEPKPKKPLSQVLLAWVEKRTIDSVNGLAIKQVNVTKHRHHRSHKVELTSAELKQQRLALLAQREREKKFGVIKGVLIEASKPLKQATIGFEEVDQAQVLDAKQRVTALLRSEPEIAAAVFKSDALLGEDFASIRHRFDDIDATIRNSPMLQAAIAPAYGRIAVAETRRLKAMGFVPNASTMPIEDILLRQIQELQQAGEVDSLLHASQTLLSDELVHTIASYPDAINEIFKLNRSVEAKLVTGELQIGSLPTSLARPHQIAEGLTDLATRFADIQAQLIVRHPIARLAHDLMLCMDDPSEPLYPRRNQLAFEVASLISEKPAALKALIYYNRQTERSLAETGEDLESLPQPMAVTRQVFHDLRVVAEEFPIIESAYDRVRDQTLQDRRSAEVFSRGLEVANTVSIMLD